MDTPQAFNGWVLLCVSVVAAGALAGATLATFKAPAGVDRWARRGGALGLVLAAFALIAGAFGNLKPATTNFWLALPLAAASVPAFALPARFPTRTRTRLAAGVALAAVGTELVAALPWLRLLALGIVFGLGLGAPFAWFAAHRIAAGEWWVDRLGPVRILLGVGGVGLAVAAQVVLAGPVAVDGALRAWGPILGLALGVSVAAIAAARTPLREALPLVVHELRPRRALAVLAAARVHLVASKRRTPLFMVVGLLGGAAAGCTVVPGLWPLGLAGLYFTGLESARVWRADRDPNLTPKEVEKDEGNGRWAAPVPLFRGVIHMGMFMLAAALSVTLFKAGAWAYATGMLLCFGVSATFHRFRWPRRAWLFFQRLDHAMIFVFMAGTFWVMAPTTGTGRLLLAGTVALAAIGAAAKLTLGTQPTVAVNVALNALYVIVGWAPPLIALQATTGFADNAVARWLLTAGGVAYTAGALVLWLERPRGWPKVFGFHEIFHALTLIAAALHFAAIYLFLLPGGA